MQREDSILYAEAVDAIEGVDIVKQSKAPYRITVEDGVVTVDAVVMSGYMKRLALMAVASVPGVVKVIDRIITDRDVEIRVAYNLSEDEDLRAIERPILVNSYRGTVTLTRMVPDESLAACAIEIARNTPGVLDVVSELTVPV